MRSQRFRRIVALGIVILLLGCIVGASVGVPAGRRELATEAIRLGHAEWVADKDGQPVFRWKEATP